MSDVSVIIKNPWTDVHHVLKVGALIYLLVFILDDVGITLSLLAQKPLVSVCPKGDFLLIFIPASASCYMVFFKVILFQTCTAILTQVVYQNAGIFWIYFLNLLELLQTTMIFHFNLHLIKIIMGYLYPRYNYIWWQTRFTFNVDMCLNPSIFISIY